MQKFAVILFTSIHLTCSICYSFVFNYLINISNTQFIEQLDADKYADHELVEITMPLHMPYINGDNRYERYDGTVEINGAQYNYVKRKISNDTLYMLCLRNTQRAQLMAAKTDYAKQQSDVPLNKAHNESTVKKNNLQQEYSSHNFAYTICANIFFTHTSYRPHIIAALVSCIIDIPGKPPQPLV